ncbi:MAG: polysaccharide biosynthesis/export family protein [Oceanipulchritudo sp.]
MTRIRAGYPWLLLLALLFHYGNLAGNSPGDGLEEGFYKLQAGDHILITVFNEPDLTVQQELDPDGVVIVPLLGRTTLGGYTLREAERLLEKKYVDEEYLISPQVTVTIHAYADQVFYIFGEVNQPGAKQFPQGKQSLDILEAITLGGDLSQYAKRSEIIIRRPIKGENRETKFIIDLEKVIRGGRNSTEDLPQIYPDDIIFVPERLF